MYPMRLLEKGEISKNNLNVFHKIRTFIIEVLHNTILADYKKKSTKIKNRTRRFRKNIIKTEILILYAFPITSNNILLFF